MKKYGYLSMFAALLFVGFDVSAAKTKITIVPGGVKAIPQGGLSIAYFWNQTALNPLSVSFNKSITLPEPSTIMIPNTKQSAFPNNDATLGFCDKNGNYIGQIGMFSDAQSGKYTLEYGTKWGYTGYYLTPA